ncbi:unnamed protein product [Paramecium primaurelia]|uniref:COPI associated protein n=2 Tax=Paramecium TaxID=5884 RepID=A0A8S1SLB3_9CILI|nr:unnamed protein product [Paramecium primaurelia]CAD8141455.1 unnamed protein product [Paramecium pentaurelia]
MKCDIHCATKILTIVCGGLIIALAISRFTNLSIEHPQQFILTIHYLWMGAVLILAEFRFAYIHQKFKILTSFFGRGLYCFFLGTLMISAFSPLQIATAVVLFVVGLIYILLQLFSKKFGWSTEEAKNPYQIPSQNQPNAYQPPYQSNVNFQQGGPALK